MTDDVEMEKRVQEATKILKELRAEFASNMNSSEGPKAKGENKIPKNIDDIDTRGLDITGGDYQDILKALKLNGINTPSKSFLG